MPPVHSSFNPLKAGPWLRMTRLCAGRIPGMPFKPNALTAKPLSERGRWEPICDVLAQDAFRSATLRRLTSSLPADERTHGWGCGRSIPKPCGRNPWPRPHTALLRQVKGVGPITALAYVLTLENPQRFVKTRDVGPYLGLVPKQEDSGESQPQLGISKTGDTMVRKLLVGSAQYILGRSDRTRTYGLTTVWAAALRARREECEEESGGSGGPEAGRLTALPLGERRSI
jgi:hypothetical protein